MNFDPLIGLSVTDRAVLDAIAERFKKSRLGQVPASSLAGVLIGKLLAFAEKRGMNWRSVVVANLPTNVTVARRTWGLMRRDEEALEYSEKQSAEYITDMADRMKEKLRDAVTGHLQAGKTAAQIAPELLAEFGELNRDWRRVAITETATAVSNGYLAQQDPGQLLVGDSAVDCCDWCSEHIQGRAYVMLEQAPLGPTEAESWQNVWVGKTNVGRSRYPVTAAGQPRSFAERWHPCIPAHPHCRCRWRKFIPSAERIEPGTNRVVDTLNLFNDPR